MQLMRRKVVQSAVRVSHFPPFHTTSHHIKCIFHPFLLVISIFVPVYFVFRCTISIQIQLLNFAARFCPSMLYSLSHWQEYFLLWSKITFVPEKVCTIPFPSSFILLLCSQYFGLTGNPRCTIQFHFLVPFSFMQVEKKTNTTTTKTWIEFYAISCKYFQFKYYNKHSKQRK